MWKPCCPKCGSLNISIERVSLGYQSRDDNSYLHCGVCGKRVYGKAKIVETLEAQKKAWQRDPEIQAEIKRKREGEEQERVERVRVARLAHEASIRQKREAAERKAKETAVRKAKNREWLAKVDAIRLEEEKAQVDKCAWMDCDEPSRETSIYCSRQCSNKNARHRAKQRKLQARA